MSDKAEAAQKWAEAKVALDAADAALSAARETQAKAQDAEFHAWQALEELAGRVTATPIAEVRNPHFEGLAGTKEWHTERAAIRHSLPQNPVG